MANEIQYNLGETGRTVYAVVRDASGQAWNGSAFATYTTTRTTWDLALTEIGTTGHYGPINLPGTGAGRWWEIYLQAGGSPSHADDIKLAVGYHSSNAETALSDYGALKPTVAGRTLDVTATGEAGIDWANIGGPTTTVNLSGTTVKTATDVETDTADIQTRLPAALVSGRIDASVGAMAANTLTASALAADAVTEIQSGLATSSALSTVDGNVTTILADTNDIQTRLPAALVSGRMDASVGAMAANVITAAATAADYLAEINAEADTALNDYGALKPTTAGRTLDVTATGEAGIDWANIGAPTTVVNLSGTTVKTATDVEADTADIQGRLPAALVSGRIDASVGAMAANTLTASALATDAVTEIQSGLATATDLATVDSVVDTILADTNDIQTRIPAALVSGRIDASVGAMAANTLTASALAADAVTEIQSGLATSAALTTVDGNVTTILADTNDIQTRLPAALVSGRMDASVGAMAANVITAAATAADYLAEINAEADTALSDYGALKPTTAGRTLDVTATGEAGIDWANIGGATTAVNLSGTTVKTATDVETDTADIQARLPASLVSGRIDASVGAMAANVITAAATAADYITEVQSGLATAAALTTIEGKIDIIDANVDTLPADTAEAILKIDLSGITGEASRSPLNALRFLRNKWSISGTTLTVYKEDDSTSAWTSTISSSAANPITGNDPA